MEIEVIYLLGDVWDFLLWPKQDNVPCGKELK